MGRISMCSRVAGAVLAISLSFGGSAMAKPGTSHAALTQCGPAWATPMRPDSDPDTGRVLQVPAISGPYDDRRCDVSGMVLAVRENGELRDVYYPDGDPRNPDKIRKIPDGRLSPPKQDQEKFRLDAVNSLRDRIAARAVKIAKAWDGATGGTLEGYLAQHPVKVLIYTHGGRVSHAGAVYAAESLAPMMTRDHYVPLFLIWNSDDLISYGDHLCCTRKGSTDPNKGFNEFFSFPTRLVSDLGSSASTALENYVQQTIRFKESILDKNFDLYRLNYDDVSQDCGYFTKPHTPKRCGNVIFPDFDAAQDQFGLLNGGRNNRRLKDNLFYTAGFVPRLATTALGSQVGAQEWDNLVRRTRLAFDNESWPDPPPPEQKSCHEPPPRDNDQIARTDEPLTCPYGAYSLFFNDLTPLLSHLDTQDPTIAHVPLDCPPNENGKIDARGCLPPDVKGSPSQRDRDGLKDVETLRRDLHLKEIPVTLEYYGHSMGAIVGDELITRYPGFPWSKIVYMAAADTLRDFKRTSTFTFDSDRSRTKLQFYSLSLHPLNESRERVFYGVFPQGSLLEWIDEMFNRPRTGDDRTFGKWKNVEMSLPTWRWDVLSHITFRVFPAQNNMNGAGPDRAEAEHRLFGLECDTQPAREEDRTPVQCSPVTHGGFTDFSFWRPMYLVGAEQAPVVPVPPAPAEPTAR
jgi:pimeloyl-ACP methyl ester carboxylesterase